KKSSREVLCQRQAVVEHRHPLRGKPLGLLVLSAVFTAPFWLCYLVSRSVSVCLIGGSLLYLLFWRFSVVRLRRIELLAASRVGESICQFAHGFRGPDFDPILVRAVYQTVQEQIGESSSVPIRSDDLFKTDLGLDGDDWDEVITRVSKLTQRQLEPVEGQGHADFRAMRVGDIVRYFIRQPRLTPA
ncbi:MAG: hypothetical protein JWO94_2032, partial [Verrucomicrobiaceae bacterium]|nr:hypothetical protein [Verrucomicrobiaceae bacterium]